MELPNVKNATYIIKGSNEVPIYYLNIDNINKGAITLYKNNQEDQSNICDYYLKNETEYPLKVIIKYNLKRETFTNTLTMKNDNMVIYVLLLLLISYVGWKLSRK